MLRLTLIAIVSVILFFPACFLLSMVLGSIAGVVVAALLMYFGFPILMLKLWPARPQECFDEEIEEGLLKNTESHSREYFVYEAVKISGSECEDPRFLLDIGDERTLGVVGGFLRDPIESGDFPSTHIRVYWDPSHESVVHIQSLGERLAPSKSIGIEEGDDRALASFDHLPRNGEIVKQPLKDIVELAENWK